MVEPTRPLTSATALSILAPTALRSRPGTGDMTMTTDGSPASSRAIRDAAGTVVGSVVFGLLVVLWLGGSWELQGTAVLVGLVVPTVAALSVLRRSPMATTGADRVTLFRGALTGACASVVVLSLGGVLPLRSWLLFALALPAVLLDAVDGWLARRFGNSSREGGKLDMETDSILVLILSVPLAITVGPWVLGIGAMRYVFLAASTMRPTLGRELSFSQSRRVIAGTQGVVLACAVMPVIPVPVAAVATGVALLLLVFSFGRDVVALERSRESGEADKISQAVHVPERES